MVTMLSCAGIAKAVVVAGVQGPRERIARHSRQRGEVEALFDDPAHFPVDPFQRHFAAGDFAVDQFGLHPVEPGVVQHAVDPVEDHALCGSLIRTAILRCPAWYK